MKHLTDYFPDCKLCGHPIDTENEDFTERFWLAQEFPQAVTPVYFHELCAAEQEMDEIDKEHERAWELAE